VRLTGNGGTIVCTIAGLWAKALEWGGGGLKLSQKTWVENETVTTGHPRRRGPPTRDLYLSHPNARTLRERGGDFQSGP